MSLKEQEDKDRDDRAMAALKTACGQLMHHFDSVQIIGTRHDSEKDGSTIAAWGTGNFYARKGSMHDWLKIQDARIHHEEGSS